MGTSCYHHECWSILQAVLLCTAVTARGRKCILLCKQHEITSCFPEMLGFWIFPLHKKKKKKYIYGSKTENNLLSHQTHLAHYFISKNSSSFRAYHPPPHLRAGWNSQNQGFPLSSVSHRVVNHYI